MEQHKISVVIPAYNEEANIYNCLQSITNANYPREKIEVIVVDNGSDDNTRTIAEGLADIVLRDDYLKISGLRNLGVEHATGEIICFIDADCIVTPDWLQAASMYIDNKEVVAWGAPPETPEKATWVQKTWYLIRKKEKPIQKVDWLESMNLFVRKELFTKTGGFDNKLETCEDVDFCYRLREYGEIIADSSIKTIHLGEAATIRIFLKKEIWRGKHNLKGLFRHGFKMMELPSLAIPFYYFASVFYAVFGIFFLHNLLWLLSCVALFILPGVVVIFKMKVKKLILKEKINIFFLLQFYFFSRTFATFNEVISLIKTKLIRNGKTI